MPSDSNHDDRSTAESPQDVRASGATVEIALGVVLLAFVLLVSMHPVARVTFALAGLFSTYVAIVRLRRSR